MTVTIYHNPRCSKSRAALAILEKKGVEPNVVRYLDTPLDAAALTALLAKLGLGARQAMRKNEAIYKELGLGDPNKSEAELIAAIAAHPILLERAIVVSGDKAVIARPPEKLLEIL